MIIESSFEATSDRCLELFVMFSIRSSWVSDMLFFIKEISPCISSIIFFIWSVDFEVCSASFRISSATTANPLPLSPALAASIAAFSASRFVWSAMFWITPTISSIRVDLSARVFTLFQVKLWLWEFFQILRLDFPRILVHLGFSQSH